MQEAVLARQCLLRPSKPCWAVGQHLDRIISCADFFPNNLLIGALEDIYPAAEENENEENGNAECATSTLFQLFPTHWLFKHIREADNITIFPKPPSNNLERISLFPRIRQAIIMYRVVCDFKSLCCFTGRLRRANREVNALNS